jgi:hypothetical protein
MPKRNDDSQRHKRKAGPPPLYRCAKCGERQALTAFPYGINRWCRRCLFGPKPRVRFVQGGAPGMGKKHGKRRR